MNKNYGAATRIWGCVTRVTHGWMRCASRICQRLVTRCLLGVTDRSDPDGCRSEERIWETKKRPAFAGHF